MMTIYQIPGRRSGLRRMLRRVATLAVEAGIPAPVLLEDVRAAVDDAIAAHARSGR